MNRVNSRIAPERPLAPPVTFMSLRAPATAGSPAPAGMTGPSWLKSHAPSPGEACGQSASVLRVTWNSVRPRPAPSVSLNTRVADGMMPFTPIGRPVTVDTAPLRPVTFEVNGNAVNTPKLPHQNQFSGLSREVAVVESV